MTQRVAPAACPFCGEVDPDKLIVELDIAGMVCRKCQATGPCLLDQEFESDEALINAATLAWNLRHTPVKEKPVPTTKIQAGDNVRFLTTVQSAMGEVRREGDIARVTHCWEDRMISVEWEELGHHRILDIVIFPGGVVEKI